MKIETHILDNSEISMDDLENIAKLKEQYWAYGIHSQMKWIEKNLQNNDKHLMIKASEDEKKVLLAYMNLTNILAEINGNQCAVIGVGNVCVERKFEHKGWGKKLMNEANHFIETSGKLGFLLCKTELIGFYKKCGWLKFARGVEVYVCGTLYDKEVMSYPTDQEINYKKLLFSRNF